MLAMVGSDGSSPPRPSPAPRWAYFPILRPWNAEYRSDEEGDDDVPGLTRDPPRRSPPPRRMVADFSMLVLEPNGLSVHNPSSIPRPPAERTLKPVGLSGWQGSSRRSATRVTQASAVSVVSALPERVRDGTAVQGARVAASDDLHHCIEVAPGLLSLAPVILDPRRRLVDLTEDVTSVARVRRARVEWILKFRALGEVVTQQRLVAVAVVSLFIQEA